MAHFVFRNIVNGPSADSLSQPSVLRLACKVSDVQAEEWSKVEEGMSDSEATTAENAQRTHIEKTDIEEESTHCEVAKDTCEEEEVASVESTDEERDTDTPIPSEQETVMRI